jgi:hypothetical protein
MGYHKLVMIYIFFSKHEKDVIFFNENILGKFLGFGRMHEKKLFFLKKNISEKTRYFNTGFLSYSVSIQPNIKQNW